MQIMKKCKKIRYETQITSQETHREVFEPEFEPPRQNLKKIFPLIETPSFDLVPPTENNTRVPSFGKYDAKEARKKLSQIRVEKK